MKVKKLRILLFVASAVSFMACSNNEGTKDKPIVSASVANEGDSSAANADDDPTPEIITGQARPPEPSPAASPEGEALPNQSADVAAGGTGADAAVVADAGQSVGDTGAEPIVVADAGQSAGDTGAAVVADAAAGGTGAEVIKLANASQSPEMPELINQ